MAYLQLLRSNRGMSKSHKNEKNVQVHSPKLKIVGKFYDGETAAEAFELLKEQFNHRENLIIWPIEDETYLPILCAKEDEAEVQKALLEFGAAKALTDPGVW